MAALEIRNVSKSFGTTSVLSNVSLDVRAGEFLTLIGASGCGKSTILRIIAGLEAQDAGEIRIGGRIVDQLRPKHRNVAMVFQSYALYPHMSASENIAMPLVMQRFGLLERMPLVGRLSMRRGRIMSDIGEEVGQVARQLQIEPLLARKPAQLSGGQRQRVALGRAMVRHPDVFLMDEPLSNLDAKLRVHMRTELTDLHRRLGVTFIYVTHDQVEAMTMSDRVALMDEGRIVQLGTPSELYHDPADIRVARFIGSPVINILPGRVVGGRLEIAGSSIPMTCPLPGDTDVSVGIRPEAVSLEARVGRPSIQAKLTHTENLGAEIFMHFSALGAEAAPIILRTPLDQFESQRGKLDGTVSLSLDPARMMVFGPDGHRIATAPPAVPLRTAKEAKLA
jgi:multiple sugar transport system ATP-binding protein